MSQIAGVMLNRLGSERHRRLAGDAIEALGMPVVGAILRDPSLTLPERHLGLVQAAEHADLVAHLDRLADMVERSLDLDAILALAAAANAGGRRHCVGPAAARPAHRAGQRRGLHASSIRMSRRIGARPARRSCRFRRSPTRRPLPIAMSAGCRAAIPNFMPGDWRRPSGFASGMHQFAERRPVHGECGGFMVLGEVLEDAEGESHRMLGLLGHATSFAERKMNLGYRRARLLADCALGPKGTEIRGHEFHYARLTEAGRGRDAGRPRRRQGRDARRFRRPARPCHRHVLPRDRKRLTMPGAPRHWTFVDDIALCLVFFTRLPVPLVSAGRDFADAHGRRRWPALSSA